MCYYIILPNMAHAASGSSNITDRQSKQLLEIPKKAARATLLDANLEMIW